MVTRGPRVLALSRRLTNGSALTGDRLRNRSRFNDREDPHAMSSCYVVYAGTLGGSVQPHPVAVEGIL